MHNNTQRNVKGVHFAVLSVRRSRRRAANSTNARATKRLPMAKPEGRADVACEITYEREGVHMKRFISMLLMTTVLVSTALVAIPALATDSFGNISLYKAGESYYATAAVTADENKEYRYMAATYDSDNKLTDIVFAAPETPETGATSISAGFPAEIYDADGTAKIMLWSNDGSLQPAAPTVTLTADNEASLPTLTEIAAGKPSGSPCSFNQMRSTDLTDGVVTTDSNNWQTTTYTVTPTTDHYIYVDLQTKQKMDLIAVNAWDWANAAVCAYDLYLTNEDPSRVKVAADKKDLVASVSRGSAGGCQSFAEAWGRHGVPHQLKDTAYRYIVLECTDTTPNWMMDEVKVYTKDVITYTEVAAGKTAGFDNLSNHDWTWLQTALTDGNTAYSGTAAIGTATPTTDNYAYIDLVGKQKLDYLEVTSWCPVTETGGGINLYLTNEDPTQGKLASDKKELIASIPYAGIASVEAGTGIYYVPSALADTAYRYIVLESAITSGRWIINEVKAYARDVVTYSYTEIAAGKPNGYGVNEGGTFDYPPTANDLTDGDLNIPKGDITAGDEGEYIYIDLGCRQKISYLDVIAYSGAGGGNVDVYLTDKNPADIVPGTNEMLFVGHVPSNTFGTVAEGTFRFYLHGNNVNKAYPYIVIKRHNATRFYVQEVQAYVEDSMLCTDLYVDAAANKNCGYGADPDGSRFDYAPSATGLTDGNMDTFAGDITTPSDNEYVYVDLEQQKNIERIEVVTLDSAVEYGGSFDIYLTNTNPAGGKVDAADKVLVANVPRITGIASYEGGTRSYYVPEEAQGAYQYVVVERSGAYRFRIQEIKAFVKQ